MDDCAGSWRPGAPRSCPSRRLAHGYDASRQPVMIRTRIRTEPGTPARFPHPPPTRPMFLRWVTAAYLVYLVVPIALLLVGSFGELWLNTLLPTGSTTQWYVDVAEDPSFRRAFAASLAVVAITCTACVAIGLPLAYALIHTESGRVRALVRVLYQLPVALPALVLAFGFILVFSSDTLPPLIRLWVLG